MTQTPQGRVSDDWCIDSPKLNERFPIYTRFNANDVLPDPISPLGADLIWAPHILPGFSNAYAQMGCISVAEANSDPEAFPAACFRYGHMYVNVTTARLTGIRAGMGWEAIDVSFFGSHPDAPPHEMHPDDGDPAIAARLAERTGWTLTTSTFPELEEDTRIADRLRAQRPDFDEMSNVALVAYARSLAPYERITWRGELIGGAQAAIGPAVVGSVIPPEMGISPFDLVGPAGDVVSAQPSYALWDLSRIVRNDAALSELFDAGVEGMVPWLKDHHPDFHQRFQAFLREFGYRGPSEWDLGADSWETKPELPLALIDRMRHLEDAQSPAARRAEASLAAERAVASVVDALDGNEEAQGTLRMGLDSARRFAGWRELGKSNCIKVINEARVALLEVGRRLAHEEHLDHPRQVFMALDGELDRLVLEPDLVVPRHPRSAKRTGRSTGTSRYRCSSTLARRGYRSIRSPARRRPRSPRPRSARPSPPSVPPRVRPRAAHASSPIPRTSRPSSPGTCSWHPRPIRHGRRSSSWPARWSWASALRTATR